jgi:hypothetical protein
MAGPQTIQRLPRGLLDMLLMKGSGDLPHEIADKLSPGVDATAFYLGDTFRHSFGLTIVLAVPGAQSVANLAVPPGEIWLPISVSVLSVPLPAGQSYSVSPCLFRNNFAGFEILPGVSSATPGQSIGVGYQFDNMTQLRPGDAIGCIVHSVTAGASQMGVYASYYRLTF